MFGFFSPRRHGKSFCSPENNIFSLIGSIVLEIKTKAEVIRKLKMRGGSAKSENIEKEKRGRLKNTE